MKIWWRKLLPGGERLKMPSRRVTLGFLLLYGLPTLVSIGSGPLAVYAQPVSHGLARSAAFLKALTAAGALLLAYALIGAIFFYCLTMFTSIVIPDTIAAYRAVRRGIAA